MPKLSKFGLTLSKNKHGKLCLNIPIEQLDSDLDSDLAELSNSDADSECEELKTEFTSKEPVDTPENIAVRNEIKLLPLTTTGISVACRNISKLPDLSHFTHLTSLECYQNCLKQLPALPPSLKSLSCAQNQLTFLPNLPPALEFLSVNHNLLTTFPELPKNLKTIGAYDNKLTPETIAELKKHTTINMYL